jgi:hypothetical protein
VEIIPALLVFLTKQENNIPIDIDDIAQIIKTTMNINRFSGINALKVTGANNRIKKVKKMLWNKPKSISMI